MSKKLTSMALLLLMVVASACAVMGSASLGEVGQQATVVGVVESVDLSPMAYDGSAEIVLQSQEHGRVMLFVQPCFGDCAEQAVQQLDVIQAGENWRATGEVRSDGELVLYQDGEHKLELVGQ